MYKKLSSNKIKLSSGGTNLVLSVKYKLLKVKSFIVSSLIG